MKETALRPSGGLLPRVIEAFLKRRRSVISAAGMLFLAIAGYNDKQNLGLGRNSSSFHVQQQGNAGAPVPFSLCGRVTPLFVCPPDTRVPRNGDSNVESPTPKSKNINYASSTVKKTTLDATQDIKMSFVRPQNVFDPIPSWHKKGNRILVINTQDSFGKIGNQINSLLHAYDYARDNHMYIGATFQSWAIDVIQQMFMEIRVPNKNMNHLVGGIEQFNQTRQNFIQQAYHSSYQSYWEQVMQSELQIVVIRNATEYQKYDEVHFVSAKNLYFYQTRVNWQETMDFHVAILRKLFEHLNRGSGENFETFDDITHKYFSYYGYYSNINDANGYDHSGKITINPCTTISYLFSTHKSSIKYSVIHSRSLEGRGLYKLSQVAQSSGCSRIGALEMSPSYVRSILEPLGLLEYPMVLLTDGQNPSVEENLLNDPIIGPKLIVLNNKLNLDGGDVMLAVLADAFIGNPASVTSGFIARARYSLGLKQSHMFRRFMNGRGENGAWSTVCQDECMFRPNVLGQLV